MKPFLLIAGYDYYPCVGTGDWIRCFSTEEEALSCIVTTSDSYSNTHTIDNCSYDWYHIVDLREWMGK